MLDTLPNIPPDGLDEGNFSTFGTIGDAGVAVVLFQVHVPGGGPFRQLQFRLGKAFCERATGSSSFG